MRYNFIISVLLPIVLSILLSIFFIPTLSNSFQNSNFSSNNFLWPTPGYCKITSKFGQRIAPTTGAATYHGGIDIAAPENSSIISIADGTVSFVGWNGANGYTVIVSHPNNLKSIYGHISPHFIVSIGDTIKKGELIAKVGPKYIEKKDYTTYIDKSGRYTNGATTGPHLHFSISKNGKKLNPESFFKHY